MKRVILCSFLVIATIFIFSCKKSNSSTSNTSPYYLTCNIGGKDMSFSDSTSEREQYDVTILGDLECDGFSADTSNAASFGLSIALGNLTKSIGVGTYTDTSSVALNVGQYFPNISNQNIIYIAGSSFLQNYPSIVTEKHFVIVISSMTDTEIKGTFSGDIFLGGDYTKPAVPVTNGKFFVKRKW